MRLSFRSRGGRLAWMILLFGLLIRWFDVAGVGGEKRRAMPALGDEIMEYLD
jgi:hypothetical protein